MSEDSTPVPITDVSHVSIGVSDMERSIAFYRDVFGWEQLFDERMEGEAFETLTHFPGAAGRACGGRIGSLRVELMQFNFIPDVPAPSGLGLRVLSMETPDAHAAHAELVRRGVPVSGPAGRGVRRAHVLRHRSRRPGHRDVRVRAGWSRRGAVRTGDGGDPRDQRLVGVRRQRRRASARARQRAHRGAAAHRCSPSPAWGSTPTSTRGCSTRSVTVASSWSTSVGAAAATSPRPATRGSTTSATSAPRVEHARRSTGRSSSPSRAAARYGLGYALTYPTRGARPRGRRLLRRATSASRRRSPTSSCRARSAAPSSPTACRSTRCGRCSPRAERCRCGTGLVELQCPVLVIRGGRKSALVGDELAAQWRGVAPLGADGDHHRRRPRPLEPRRRRLPRGAAPVPRGASPRRRAAIPESVPRSCKPAPTGQVPVVDRNRCEAKEDCVQVCPYDVFEVRVLTPEERAGVSLRGG